MTEDELNEDRSVEEYSRKELLRIAGGAGLGIALGSSFLAPIAAGATRGGARVGKPIALHKVPTKLFDPKLKPGLKPPLPRRIGWSLPANGELFTNLDNAVRAAAKSRTVDYISAQANGDTTKQFQQTQDFLSRGIGALIIVDLAPPALVPLQLKAIGEGIAVLSGPFAVATCQLTTDQYGVGKAQGVAAVKWIKQNLGGQAEVGMFNADSVPSLRPRYKGIRDALAAGGSGIKLVADVAAGQGVSADEGFKLTNTVLQTHPGLNVWIGSDSVLAGTLSALEAAGKAGNNIGLFGVDGDAQALDAIVKGGPYKSTQAFAFPVVGYAWGKYASDWLGGKSIPIVLMAGSVELKSKATIDAFNAAMASPARAFTDNQKSFKYFRPLGNTSYEHHRYLAVVA